MDGTEVGEGKQTNMAVASLSGLVLVGNLMEGGTTTTL